MNILVKFQVHPKADEGGYNLPVPGVLLGFFSPSAEMLHIGTVALRVISYSLGAPSPGRWWPGSGVFFQEWNAPQ